MTDEDKLLFKILIDNACLATETPLFNRDNLREWFTELNRFTVAELEIKIDQYILEHKKMPSISYLLDRHEVTIKPRNPTPLSEENVKIYIKDMKEEATPKGMRHPHHWAHEVLKNPLSPTLAVKWAKQVLKIE